MKKIFLLCFCFFICLITFGQGYFQKLDRKHKKYFVSAGYGVGTASWYSKLEDSELYDKNGNVIKSGNLQFTAKNPSTSWNFEVSCPITTVRLGMGISFEEYFLDKIVLKNKNLVEGNYMLFDESFRFDKFFVFIEAPFAPETDKNYSFSAKLHLGYFSYTGVERFNFFGEEPLARMYLMNLGLVADYKIFPHIYAFAFPNFEFKYFQNNKYESPSDINHKILGYTLIGGIRVDVSRE